MPKLTKTIVDNIAAAGREKWVWCDTLPGFGVRAQVSGRKTYVCRYRTRDGQQRKVTLARCCDMPPDRARELARQTFADIAAGGDPAKKRADDRQAPTMADLKERYMRLHAIPYKKPSSIRLDERNWKKHILPALGTRRVASITKADVQALHVGLAFQPATANHVRALISKAMNLAIEWGWRTDTNPCVGVRRNRIRQRETVLTPAQLRAIYVNLVPGPFSDLIRLLMLTGCRLSEIMTARREWVDTQRRLLLLPDSKVGQRRIALPRAAIEIIQAMPDGGPWLIPGKIAGTHMQRPHMAWYRLLKAAGLPRGIRIHDLRHTAGSLGHMAGLTQRQIADLLGHANMATTERYLHGYQDDAERAADVVADRIVSAWRATAPA